MNFRSYIVRVFTMVVMSSIASWSFATVPGAKSERPVLDKAAKRLKNDAQAHTRKWRSTIRNLQSQTASKVKPYQKDIEALKAQVHDKVEEYKQDVEEIKNQTIKLLRNSKSHLTDQETDFAGSEIGEPHIYIFVSSSMKKNNLINLARQAKEQDATLVMRGLIGNSYLKTVQYFQKIIEKTGQGIVIDPEMFKTYQVHEVPTFVAARPMVYDKLSGNVSLKYAISEMKSRGEVFRSKVKR